MLASQWRKPEPAGGGMGTARANPSAPRGERCGTDPMGARAFIGRSLDSRRGADIPAPHSHGRHVQEFGLTRGLPKHGRA